MERRKILLYNFLNEISHKLDENLLEDEYVELLFNFFLNWNFYKTFPYEDDDILRYFALGWYISQNINIDKNI